LRSEATKCGSSSLVECLLAKEKVTGPIPASRSVSNPVDIFDIIQL
jgi:hypothetical protein